MATRLMSLGMSSSWGDRVSTPHNTFHKQTIDDFIGIDVATVRCEAIDSADFPAHEEALRTLHCSVEMWLGVRPPGLFDF
jgi:hypothetical protein